MRIKDDDRFKERIRSDKDIDFTETDIYKLLKEEAERQKVKKRGIEDKDTKKHDLSLFKKIFHCEVFFNEPTHTYTHKGTGARLDSVTTVIKDFLNEFDSQKHSARKAEQRGVTQQQVLDEWETNRLYKSSLGTYLHRKLECLSGHKSSDAIKENIYGYDKDFHKIILYEHDKVINKFLKEYLTNYTNIANEYIIHNEYVAGQVDYLGINNETSKLEILDWKFTKKPNKNFYYDMMKEPLNNIPDNSYHKFALQLSKYKYLMKLRGIHVDSIKVVNFNRRTYKVIELPYMEKEVKLMLSIKYGL